MAEEDEEERKEANGNGENGKAGDGEGLEAAKDSGSGVGAATDKQKTLLGRLKPLNRSNSERLPSKLSAAPQPRSMMPLRRFSVGRGNQSKDEVGKRIDEEGEAEAEAEAEEEEGEDSDYTPRDLNEKIPPNASADLIFNLKEYAKEVRCGQHRLEACAHDADKLLELTAKLQDDIIARFGGASQFRTAHT